MDDEFLSRPYGGGSLPSHAIVNAPWSPSRIELSIVNLREARFESCSDSHETALVVLAGKGRVVYTQVGLSECEHEVARRNVFTEFPSVFLLPRRTSIRLETATHLEVAVIRVACGASYAPVVLPPSEFRSELRGDDVLGGVVKRHVRAYLGDPNAPLERTKGSNLIVGETINLQGRSSGMPRHSHKESEIYYFRMQPDSGQGTAHLNDTPIRIRHHDVLNICEKKTHMIQADAGAHVYYLWVIHDPKREYVSRDGRQPFEIAGEDRWLLDQSEIDRTLLKESEIV